MYSKETFTGCPPKKKSSKLLFAQSLHFCIKVQTNFSLFSAIYLLWHNLVYTKGNLISRFPSLHLYTILLYCT